MANREAARSQLDAIGKKAPPRDVAPLLLINRGRVAEKCPAAFIGVAGESRINDPEQSTNHSEPTSTSATDFDRDALSFPIHLEENIR